MSTYALTAIIKYLPMSLATQDAAHRYEKLKKQKKEGALDDEDGEMDLFSRTSELIIGSLNMLMLIVFPSSSQRS